MSETRLIDIGERRLIAEYLRPRYAAKTRGRFGDDCAVIYGASRPRDEVVVATIDPGPRPVAWDLGFQDYYHWGWLTAAVNWSDIAAAGARPLGLVTSLTLPNEMSVGVFQRLLDGIDACCNSVGAGVQGGNLKEGETVHCEAAAFGVVRGGDPLSRHGAQPGDVICALGNTGLFWSGVLALEAGISLSDDEMSLIRQALLRPTPLVGLGQLIREHGLASTCTDNSDGLYGALRELSESSQVGAELDAGSFNYPEMVLRISHDTHIDPIRLAFGFGDMQLICSTPQDRIEDLRLACEELSIWFSPLGRVTEGSDLLLLKDGKSARLANLDNERFTSTSQFTAGIKAYRSRIFEGPLLQAEMSRD
jgi:thiamine-monophosphate kinase